MRQARHWALKRWEGTEGGSEPVPPHGNPTARASRHTRPPETAPSAAPAHCLRRSASGGGRGSPPPARDAPDTPEESCAARGPEWSPLRALARSSRAPPLTAHRRGFVLSGVASSTSAQAPEPPPGPPHSRAPGALGAKLSARPPRHRCQRAPRREMRPCRLGRRYCEPGWRGRVGCGRTGRRAGHGGEAQPEGGGNRNVTRAREARMGRRKRGPPPPSAGPRPPACPTFSTSSSPGTRSSRAAVGLPLHSGPDSTLPCPARPLSF